MRPTTGPTVYHDDIVGTVARQGRAPAARHRLDERRICREGDPDWSSGVPVREETIPVRRAAGREVARASIQRVHQPVRRPAPRRRLELTYLQSASDLAQMVAEGRFPFSGDEPILVRSPAGRRRPAAARPGGPRDLRLAPTRCRPTGGSGLHADLVGAELGRVTATLVLLRRARSTRTCMIVASGRAARETEVEAGGTIVQLRAIPLIVGGGRIGALVLIRDVTELRRRERELMTKDATIREIHHRVKNNLQTVAALLRLQARRLRRARGRGRRWRRRCGGSARSRSCTRRCRTRRRSRRLRRHRRPVIAMAGEVSAAGGAGHAAARRAASGCCRR